MTPPSLMQDSALVPGVAPKEAVYTIEMRDTSYGGPRDSVSFAHR